MRAVQLVSETQGLQLVDWPMPDPKEGFNIIQVSHAALNHRDLWISKGRYAGIKYPVILGSDVCAYDENKRRVIVNPGFNWGDDPRVQSKSFHILGMPEHGSFAEYVSVPVQHIYSAPAHLTDAQVSALPLAGITAYRTLVIKCKPQPGENLLITGIGGGVALMVLQFALALKLNVYVSSSDHSKIEQAIQLGAKGGVNYLDSKWDVEVLDQSGGFDMIVDSAGGESFSKFPKICKPAARIAMYGGTNGVISNLSPQQLFWKQISIYGSTMGSPSEFAEMLSFIIQFKIIPIVDSIYELADFNSAFNRMNSKQQFGKIVLNVSK